MNFLRRLNRSATAWSMATAALRAGSVVIVLPFILRGLSADELGLWYVFLSIASLATLLDLGFSDTTAQATGYVWAGVQKLQPRGIEINSRAADGKPNFPLMAQLEATMRAYYALLAVAVLAIMLTAGSWWIWTKTGHLNHRTSIRAAWLFFSVGTSYNIFGTAWSALLTGINGIRQAQQILALSLLANYLATIAAIQLHLGIWALVGGQFLMGLIVRLGGRLYFHKMAGAEYLPAAKTRDWRLLKVLWPMAWRGGLVNVGTFLIMGAGVLVCSAYLGLAETASYGLTLQVLNLLMATSINWLAVKRPLITQLRAQDRTEAIARLFSSRTQLALLTYLLGALAVLWLGNFLLNLIHARTLLVPLPELAALLLICLLETHHVCYALLITTENENPFIVPSLASGLAIVALSLLLTPKIGLWGLVISFGVVQLCYNNWWPIGRGIRGLNLSPKEYWRQFFGFR